MVIGFDGSRAFNKDKTGTENYSYQLLKHLAKIDTQIYFKVYVRPGTVVQAWENVTLSVSEGYNSKKLYSSDPSGARPQNDNFGWPKNFQFKTINFHRFWTQAGLAAQTFTHLSSGDKDKLDVLFVPSHTLPIIRNPKLKTVITVHDLGAEYLPKMHQLKQQLYLKYMTHRQLKGATKIIAVSKATKDDLVKRVKIDPKKIEVIYEGVDREVFKQVKNDVLLNSLKGFGLEKGKYFLFVGTIQPRKNLKRLIMAFKNVTLSAAPFDGGKGINSGLYSSAVLQSDKNRSQYDKFKLVLVGTKGWLSEEIYALPKKLGIEDQVKFLGHVEDEKLPALYSGAIAFTYPSLFEGFGLPILEAMSCGTPVITSEISSMPEVAGEAAILVDPLKVEEIAEAMGKLAEDTKMRDNLIQKGYKQIEKFSWEKAARETLEVFERLK